MKKKMIQYQIAEPCHEDWGKMKPEAKGRFCESCSKTVVDFSSMSDCSIANYLEEKEGERICGRFRPDQLEKTYVYEIHQSVLFDLKTVALGLTFTALSAVSAHGQEVLDTVACDKVFDSTMMTLGYVGINDVGGWYNHLEKTSVEGKVLFPGKDCRSVQITLMSFSSEKLVSVRVSKSGDFKLPLDWKKHPYYIMATASGYEPVVIYLKRERDVQRISVRMKRERSVEKK